MRTDAMDRRKFLKVSGLAVGGLGMTAGALGCVQAREAGAAEPAGRIGNWRAMRKTCVHMHISGGPRAFDAGYNERLLRAIDTLGIDEYWISIPVTSGEATRERVESANNAVIEFMRNRPACRGMAFLNPGLDHTMEELDRCLEAGMIGVKLYHQYRYDDPTVFPLAEACIERGIPLLGHSVRFINPEQAALQPNASDGSHFSALSRDYPELKLIMGHINGGGDWEWEIKAIRDCGNIHLDTSGSVQDDGVIDMAVRELGHKRLLFATDNTMAPAVGRILAADLTDDQREDIFWRNARALLDGNERP